MTGDGDVGVRKTVVFYLNTINDCIHSQCKTMNGGRTKSNDCDCHDWWYHSVTQWSDPVFLWTTGV